MISFAYVYGKDRKEPALPALSLIIGGWGQTIGTEVLFRPGTIKMRNADYPEEQEQEVMDVAPTAPEDAHLRIEEAERGIANGEVVLHADVMKHSYELLYK